jgi:hypothetical protein
MGVFPDDNVAPKLTTPYVELLSPWGIDEGAVYVVVKSVLAALALRVPEVTVKPDPRQHVMAPNASRGVIVHVDVPPTRTLELDIDVAAHDTEEAVVGIPCSTVTKREGLSICAPHDEACRRSVYVHWLFVPQLPTWATVGV